MKNKLPTWRKWMYGSGDFGFSITSTIVGAYFLFFLVNVVGIRPGIAGIAFFIGRLWDVINDPLFGYISDHTRTRWGRRRPFLLFGPIPFAIAFSLMWWRPPIQGDIALVVYYAIVYVIYDAAATMIYMPYFALTPELTSDYDERTSITSVRAFFSILGSIVAFIIPGLIVNRFIPEHASNVLLMGVIFGAISALPLFIVFFGTRERPEFMQQKQPGLWESIRSSVQNRPFVFSTILYIFTWLTIDILQTILIFFIANVIYRETDQPLIMGTIFGVAILALPFWTWTSRRLNKRLAYILGMAFFAAVLLVLFNMTPTTPLWLILILCVLAGIGVSAAHVIPWAIIPDAIEYGELKTGKRSEGMFYSLISLAQKTASALAILLVSQLLDAGYVQNSMVQSASTTLNIRLLTGPVPAVLMCMGILFAILYPLGRERYTEIALELEERRFAGSKEG